jgi:hypothetical protein
MARTGMFFVVVWKHQGCFFISFSCSKIRFRVFIGGSHLSMTESPHAVYRHVSCLAEIDGFLHLRQGIRVRVNKKGKNERRFVTGCIQRIPCDLINEFFRSLE